MFHIIFDITSKLSFSAHNSVIHITPLFYTGWFYTLIWEVNKLKISKFDGLWYSEIKKKSLIKGYVWCKHSWKILNIQWKVNCRSSMPRKGKFWDFPKRLFLRYSFVQEKGLDELLINRKYPGEFRHLCTHNFSIPTFGLLSSQLQLQNWLGLWNKSGSSVEK